MHRKDKYLNSLRTRVENNKKIAIKCYTIISDLLCQGDLNGAKRVVNPERILDEIIAEIHEIYVHIGSQKMYKMLREKILGIYIKRKKKFLLKVQSRYAFNIIEIFLLREYYAYVCCNIANR